MLTIHAYQMALFSKAAEASFEERVVRYLREQFEDARLTPRREIVPGVRRQIGRAVAHGLTTERHVATYIAASWIMGLDFDEKIPYLRDLLGAPMIDADRKIELMSAHIEELFAALTGGQ